MSAQQTILSLGEVELAELERKYERRRELAGHRAGPLFSVLAQELTDEETVALKFLYANMPICDLADHDGELFLTHIRQALATRQTAPWGAGVPDRLFLYYVLPMRINTENLEDYQAILHRELAARTSGLTMAEAILETNYWCHEKATYIGSDLRTLSPLGMLRNARGRCGEESTLAVAALRSIGIPARQCYTPRWAHCDDNHAWVEAWADGQWHYIGACEPEAVLDEGWFSAPARRAMLVHTRVPSGYVGPEPVTVADQWHTELNLLDLYAPVRTLRVTVLDAAGAPVADAEVQFQLYNYAELFPLATIRTDARGEASFRTGYGDLIVRAVRDGYWDEQSVAADVQELTLALRRTGQPEGTATFDMTPPPERPGEPREPLAEEQLARHRERVAEGERLRQAYEASFLGESQARDLAEDLALPPERVWPVLETARGNARELAAFLRERSPQHGLWPLRLLETLHPKDLTDTARGTLDDYLQGGLRWLEGAVSESAMSGPAGSESGPQQSAMSAASGGGDDSPDASMQAEEERWLRYVLCPRVHFEMLAPYKAELMAAFSPEEVEAFRASPSLVAERLARDWTITREPLHMQGKATPLGTFRLRAADRLSVDILLVALLRSLGVAARLHPATQHPEYWQDGQWRAARASSTDGAGHSDTDLTEGNGTVLDEADLTGVSGDDRESCEEAAAGVPVREDTGRSVREDTGVAGVGVSQRGTLRLVRRETAGEDAGKSRGESGPELAYRDNFSFGRLEDGFYRTLQYPFGEKDVYDRPFELEPGNYRLITGVRLQGGEVLGRFYYFRIAPGQETVLTPELRQPALTYPALGTADGQSVLHRWDETGADARLGELAGSQGAVVAWIDPRREPSRHLLRESGELRAEYEATGLPLLLIVPEGEESARFDPEAHPDLPDVALLLRDPDGAAQRMMLERAHPGETSHPYLYVVDGELAVRYAQSGYKPGSVREALHVLQAVRN